MHIYLLCPPGDDEPMNQVGVKGFHGLDVRAWHGLVTAPGSLNIKTGRRYRILDGCRLPVDGTPLPLAVCPPPWWDWLPKKAPVDNSASVAPRNRCGGVSTRSARVKREHDPVSFLIGDGPGFNGFQNPISKYARDYFFAAGVDAPASFTRFNLKVHAESIAQDFDVLRPRQPWGELCCFIDPLSPQFDSLKPT
jgi:hypothetical protein